MPLYNKEKSVGNTINSVISQTYKNFELIVVNDGSTDGSESVVSGFHDSRIRLINKLNGGVSSARNRGIAEAKYDLICVLDSDDIWKPDYLEQMYRLYINYPNAELFCLNYIKINAGKFIKTKNKFVPKFGIVADFYRAISENPRSGMTSQSSIMFKKNTAIAVGGYPEGVTHTEDVAFCCKLANVGDVAFSCYEGAYYVLDSENRSSTSIPVERRYVVEYLEEVLKSYDFSEKKKKGILRFMAKNNIHTAYNCLRMDDIYAFKKILNDEYTSFSVMSNYYKLVFIFFKFLGFNICKRVFKNV